MLVILYKIITINLLTINNLSCNLSETYAIDYCMQSHLPEPYRSTSLLPFFLDGWFSNQLVLTELFQQHEIEICIEVGCWLGSSSLFLASLLKGGTLYAVDHWLGSSEHQADEKLPTIYQQFLSNVVHAAYTQTIVPVRFSSIAAAQALDVKADLIYIDASHETEDVYADLLAWSPRLNKNGILCGDDWHWASVRKAVTCFAQKHNLAIHDVGNFWRLYKN